MGPLCRGKTKLDVEDRDPDILTCLHRQVVCFFECQITKSNIGLQDWATSEAQNQRNICSAIMFVSRRNQHARLGHTHVWPFPCAYLCVHIYIYTMCVCACSTIFEYHCYVIILFVAASDDQTIKSLQRLGQVRPREDGGSQVYRSDIAGPHVDEERLVGLGPWGWGRQVFELYLNSLQIDSQFFPTS